MIQKYTIGRNPDNDIVFSHPMISGYHADIVVDDSMGYPRYTFVDHSTNGTTVNGQFLRRSSCFVVYNDAIILAGVVAFDWRALSTLSNNVPRKESAYDSSLSRNRQESGLSFVGALQSFFNKYVDFKGRATRREYWFMVLWFLIFSTALSILTLPASLSSAGSLLSEDIEDLLSSFYYLGWTFYLWLIYDLVFFIPSLSLLVRRIHDTGQDGLWILMLLVPIANIVFLFIWTLTPSEPRINRWGPNV